MLYQLLWDTDSDFFLFYGRRLSCRNVCSLFGERYISFECVQLVKRGFTSVARGLKVSERRVADIPDTKVVDPEAGRGPTTEVRLRLRVARGIAVIYQVVQGTRK